MAQEINKACRQSGFLAITGHGIPQSIIDNALKSSKEFFDLPTEEKMKLDTMSEEYPYGYNGVMGEVLSDGKAAEDGTNSTVLIPDMKAISLIG